MAAVLDIASIANQHAFNLTRWEEICRDPVLGKVDYRIETNRFGHILMTVPPGFDHGEHQFDIAKALGRLLNEGTAVTECPISTSDGIKAADVVWISRERRAGEVRKNVLIEAPEICVEILSPTNARQEIEHKKRKASRAAGQPLGMAALVLLATVTRHPREFPQQPRPR